MQKGISFYYGFNTDAKTRAQNIKNAGFDCIITSPDPRFNKQNGTLKKQVGYFKKFGIKHSSLHMQYSTNLLPYFWQDCKLCSRLYSASRRCRGWSKTIRLISVQALHRLLCDILPGRHTSSRSS